MRLQPPLLKQTEPAGGSEAKPSGRRAFAPESRIDILESTPGVLEVRLRPPGWKRSFTRSLAFMFAMLVLWGVYLAVPLARDWWNNAHDVTALDLLLPTGMGLMWLVQFLLMAWGAYRNAEEWTILRLEEGRVRLRRPRPFREDLWQEFQVKGAKKFPRERYSAIHQAALLTGGENVTVRTPLEYPDVRWLIDEINQRVAAREENHAGPS